MPPRLYTGKTVVITGAAGGMGQALCRCFAAAGANVAALDLDGAVLAAFAGNLGASFPDVRVLGLTCDITDDEACKTALRRVIETFGGVDVLVNNAGISHRSSFRDTDPAVIRRVMNVNFFGAVSCTKAALDSLLQRRGQIVVLSSIAGFSPLLERTGYSASKHALHGFFDSLRSEIEADGVEVMLVCPSFVATGIERAALSGSGGRVDVPRKTIGEEVSAEDMAQRIFAAASAGKRLSLPTPLARLSWWVSRLSPTFFARQMKRRLTLEN